MVTVDIVTVDMVTVDMANGKLCSNYLCPVAALRFDTGLAVDCC